MIIINIWHYLCGYVIIKINSTQIEQLINLFSINDIYVWGLERLSYTELRIRLSYKNVFHIKGLINKTASTIYIEKKIGLPFILKIVKFKKSLALIFIILFSMIYYTTTKIWMIEINGLVKLSKIDIVKTLAKIGLTEGISKSKLDERYIERRLLVEEHKLSYAGIQIRGSKLIIQCKERELEPEIFAPTACDIIADKSGIIYDMDVLNGYPNVAVNDTVSKGQVLVTGKYVKEGQKDKYVHSIADIKARTWYEKSIKVNLKQNIFEKTGKHKVWYKVYFMNKNIFYEIKKPFEKFQKTIHKKFPVYFGDFIFPIKLVREDYFELKENIKILSVDEAKEQCNEKLNMQIEEELNKNGIILSRNIIYKMDDNAIEATINAETIEDIGVKVIAQEE